MNFLCNIRVSSATLVVWTQRYVGEFSDVGATAHGVLLAWTDLRGRSSNWDVFVAPGKLRPWSGQLATTGFGRPDPPWPGGGLLRPAEPPSHLNDVRETVPPVRRTQVINDLCVMVRADGRVDEAERKRLRDRQGARDPHRAGLVYRGGWPARALTPPVPLLLTLTSPAQRSQSPATTWAGR
jgi:hypothetical protein